MTTQASARDEEDLSNALTETEIRDKLRECFKIYTDRKNKFSFRFQTNKRGENDLGVDDDHSDFFLMTYKNIFTEPPETQTRFLQLLFDNITGPIKPPSLPLYSDLMTKRIRKSTENKSYPYKIRDLLAKQCFRRIATLKQQKYKTMQRFAHFCRSVEQESYAELFIQDRMSTIDEEIGILEQRFNRLKHENFFSESMAFPDTKPKPKLLNDFMAQNTVHDNDSSVSNISKDDVMCYLREVVYKRKLSRPLRKFVCNLKWLHQSKRFEILRNAHDNINNTRLQGERNFKEFVETYRSVIGEYLIQEEKNDQGWGLFLGELLSITEDDPYPSLNQVKDYPPMIPTNQPEMMKSLQLLTKHYKIIDWDTSENIQTFLYNITNIFKIIFENQTKIYPSGMREAGSSKQAKSTDSDFDDNQFKNTFQDEKNNEGANATLLDRVMLEEERLKKDLEDSRLTREPYKIKETPAIWLKELVYKREPPVEEKMYYQILGMQKNHDVNLKNLIDLVGQTDIELINSTIANKVDQARVVAENKLTNFIENFRYKFKTSDLQLSKIFKLFF